MAESKYMSIQEAAAALHVSESTVRRAFDTGKLDGDRTPGGHRRILRECVDRRVADRDFGVTFPEHSRSSR